ncbi:MAG: HEAT repeat domain-containing protein [Planctomycetota bacterium]
MFPFNRATNYSGGVGTPEDPFQIWTPEQMNTIGLNPIDWDKHFKLMSDIDMSMYTGTQYNIIGNSTTHFTGSFEGNSHVITNLTYQSRRCDSYEEQMKTPPVGLFGSIACAVIQNLALKNVRLSGYRSAGALASFADEGSEIAYCCATGNIGGDNGVGGLVGINRGTLTDCYAKVSAVAPYVVGGLVGSNVGSLNGCHSTGSVMGRRYSGGLVGRNEGKLSACYSTSLVIGTDDPVGGLVGYNKGFLTACYAAGSTVGSDEAACIGGLVGENRGALIACYATGSVDGRGKDRVGGLVGSNGGSLNICYAIGPVDARNARKVGGVAGANSGSMTACFWDIQTSGWPADPLSGPYDPIGKKTSEMQTQSTFALMGWDFYTDQTESVYWTIPPEGGDYPQLIWQRQAMHQHIQTLANKENTEENRLAAISSLHALGDKRVVKPLIEALRDESDRIRWTAALALGGSGDVRRKRYMWHDRRYTLMNVCRYGGLGDVRAVEPLIQALEDKSMKVRLAAASSLGGLGDFQAAEPLIRALRDPSKIVRREAVYSLARLGCKEASEHLTILVKDESATVRLAAVRALAFFKEACSADPFLTALEDQSARVRYQAASTLGHLNDTRAVNPLIMRLDDRYKYTRCAAASALGWLKDTRAVKPLIMLLRDKDDYVRYAAVQALEEVQDNRAIKPLIKVLKNDTKLVQNAAAKALEKFGDKRKIRAALQDFNNTS